MQLSNACLRKSGHLFSHVGHQDKIRIFPDLRLVEVENILKVMSWASQGEEKRISSRNIPPRRYCVCVLKELLICPAFENAGNTGLGARKEPVQATTPGCTLDSQWGRTYSYGDPEKQEILSR